MFSVLNKIFRTYQKLLRIEEVYVTILSVVCILICITP